jgi:hypothetical protein
MDCFRRIQNIKNPPGDNYSDAEELKAGSEAIPNAQHDIQPWVVIQTWTYDTVLPAPPPFNCKCGCLPQKTDQDRQSQVPHA